MRETLQQEVDAEREKLRIESSVLEREREARRQSDKQRGYKEEKMLALERELQGEVRFALPAAGAGVHAHTRFFDCEFRI